MHNTKQKEGKLETSGMTKEQAIDVLKEKLGVLAEKSTLIRMQKQEDTSIMRKLRKNVARLKTRLTEIQDEEKANFKR